MDPLENPKLDRELGGLRKKDGTLFTDNGHILMVDSDYVFCGENPMRQIYEKRDKLWNHIGSLQWGDVKVKRNRKIWHRQKERYLIPERVTLTEDGEPVVLFRVSGGQPGRVEYVKLFGNRIADLVEDDVLVSQEQVDEEIREAFEM